MVDPGWNAVINRVFAYVLAQVIPAGEGAWGQGREVRVGTVTRLLGKKKHKPFFLIRRSLLLLIRSAPHQYISQVYRYGMVQPDAKIRYLEFELEEKEKMVRMMESSGSGAGEDRVAALEKKVNEMEALVKGLTQELLDLKSIAMKMSKQTEERSRQELKRMQPIVQGSQVSGSAAAPQQGGSTVVIRKGARVEAEPQAPAEPAMDMIMQTDGTMKLEPRRGKRTISLLRPAMAGTRKEPRPSPSRAI